jgi:hypothetical protein
MNNEQYIAQYMRDYTLIETTYYYSRIDNHIITIQAPWNNPYVIYRFRNPLHQRIQP